MLFGATPSFLHKMEEIMSASKSLQTKKSSTISSTPDKPVDDRTHAGKSWLANL